MAVPRVKHLNVNSLKDVIEELVRLGCDTARMETVASRSVFRALRVENLAAPDALALREEMLAAGGEAVPTAAPTAVAPAGLPEVGGGASVVLSGTLDAFRRCLGGLSARGEAMKRLGGEIKTVLMNVEGSRAAPAVKCGRGELKFGGKTFVMGIINATPDSFFDGGRNFDVDTAVKTAIDMAEAGVDIIDVGGESTRPGSEPVPEEEEARRVIPLIREIRAALKNIFISIDTSKASIAEKALEAGADIVNDISALRFDGRTAAVAAEHEAPVCLMHMLGTPREMQKAPRYETDVVFEIIDFLAERIDYAVSKGIDENGIIIDPGIGFGKTLEHNLAILNRLIEFKALGRPILVGTSRKSFIGKVLDAEPPERLEGTLASVALAAAGGADIVRVHDYREALRAARLADSILRTRRTAGSNGKLGTDG
ncbi:MAG: dihydropteroate synthase [bacterium]